jgi:16S rRNA (guanine527-N7)-methyltransferase
VARARTPDPTPLAADRARAATLVHVSRETWDRLDVFIALLTRWQATSQLIAWSTVPHIWTRHVVDSLQVIDHAPGARIWIDYGSGAGFPGLVIACALADTVGARVHLVESNAKKAAFLREAIRLTGAPAEVHATRMENVVESFPGHPDIVTARAVAPLTVLLVHCAPLLQQGAVGLFLKGRDVETELREAATYWKMRVTLIPSRTDPEGRIVKVEGLESRDQAVRD